MRIFPSFAQLTAAGAVFSVALVAGSVQAQTPITLTAATFPVSPATVYALQQLTPPPVAFPALQAGGNQVWDFSTLAPRGQAVTAGLLPPPVGSPFPGATVAEDFVQNLSTLEIVGLDFNALTPAGYVSFGRVLPRQVLSIGGATGNNRDSLVVTAQTYTYPTPRLIQVFPATAGTVTNQTHRLVTNLQITVAAFGLNRTPASRVQHITEVDSVIGWGTIRVPVAGQPGVSAPIAVLLHRQVTIERDSFYLAGQPAPGLLLQGLGVNQGDSTVLVQDVFQRLNSAQPVFGLEYESLDRQIPLFYVSAETTLPLGTRRETALIAPATLWPNPASAGQAVQVLVPGLATAVSVTLTDALGRAVFTDMLRPGAPLALPVGLAGGTYLLAAPLPDGRALRRRLVVR